MHFVIRRMDRRRFPQMRADTDLPEFTEMVNAAQQARTAARPERAARRADGSER
jgi:hypothetical protein